MLENSNELQCTVTTLAGFEEILLEELKELGIENPVRGTRSAAFTGSLADVYRINYRSRFAIRVLIIIHSYKAFDDKRLHSKAMQFDWSSIMGLNDTFAINAAVHSDYHHHSQFAALRIKDAIADFFNQKEGRRPSVDIKRPDIRVHLHIDGQHVTLSLDSSGDSLHKRGYRTERFEAPLSEVLAAGMIKLSGWTPDQPFWDPMCGSGTLICEAAMIALDIPSQIRRQRFGFMNWKNFDSKLWNEIKNEVSPKSELPALIKGSDMDRYSLPIVKKHLKNIGVDHLVQVEQLDYFKSELPAPDPMIIMNPPYGVRLPKEEIEEFYSRIASHMKHKLPGSTVWVFTSNMSSMKRFGLRPSKKLRLFNGSLECAYHKFEIFAGKRKDHLRSEN